MRTSHDVNLCFPSFVVEYIFGAMSSFWECHAFTIFDWCIICLLITYQRCISFSLDIIHPCEYRCPLINPYLDYIMLSNPSLNSMQFMWLKVLFCAYHIDHVMVMNITWDIRSIISYLQEYVNYLSHTSLWVELKQNSCQSAFLVPRLWKSTFRDVQSIQINTVWCHYDNGTIPWLQRHTYK